MALRGEDDTTSFPSKPPWSRVRNCDCETHDDADIWFREDLWIYSCQVVAGLRGSQ